MHGCKPRGFRKLWSRCIWRKESIYQQSIWNNINISREYYHQKLIKYIFGNQRPAVSTLVGGPRIFKMGKIMMVVVPSSPPYWYTLFRWSPSLFVFCISKPKRKVSSCVFWSSIHEPVLNVHKKNQSVPMISNLPRELPGIWQALQIPA